MSGAEIRKTILANGLKLWQVADELGVSDANFSRMLRHDFNEKMTNQVYDIIKSLKKE